MRILFICGSLEQGKDGVGDYTLRLASELVSRQHVVTIVAFNDKHILQTVSEIGGVSIPILRLPHILNSSMRLRTLNNWITKHRPEWVSLQYVGFGYQKYGVPFDLLKLSGVIGTAKLHIMFHELWCGMSAAAPVKERVLGKLQKFFLKYMIARLKPEAVFTNVSSYAKFLKKIGVQTTLAPVFGNINPSEIYDLEKVGTHQKLVELAHCFSDEQWLVLGFFGAIYSNKGVGALMKSASNAAKKSGKHLGVLRVGPDNECLKQLTESINGARYLHTGRLVPAMVNYAMSFVHCGVMTTPADGLDKSGSAIAWLERGIPVLVAHLDSSYNKAQLQPQGVIQVKDMADIKYALNIRRDDIRRRNRLQESIESYLAINNRTTVGNT